MWTEQISKGENYEEAVVKNYSCDPTWPICLYDFTYKILCEQFFSYRIGTPIEIIDNYF